MHAGPLRLYTYWRSSAAYRVRIALNLKRLEYESKPVHLARDGGEQHAAPFRDVNPQALVPVLDHDGRLIRQSLAIIEYLEETFGGAALLPDDAPGRARVRGLAQMVACEIHPLNNLRVLKYLTGPLALQEQQKAAWYAHWVELGFSALEALLSTDGQAGLYCHGDVPGLADATLVPQVYNARRFECDLAPYPTILRIERACLALDAFAHASPERQPDAV